MKLPKEDHNGLLNNIGCCLIELKRYKEARVCLVEALEVKDRHPIIYYNLLRLNYFTKRYFRFFYYLISYTIFSVKNFHPISRKKNLKL